MDHKFNKMYDERKYLTRSQVRHKDVELTIPPKSGHGVDDVAILHHGNDETLRECVDLLKQSVNLIVLGNGEEAAQVIAQIECMCENYLSPSDDQLLEIYKNCMSSKDNAESMLEVLKLVAKYHRHVFVLNPKEVDHKRRSIFFSALFGTKVDVIPSQSRNSLSLTISTKKQLGQAGTLPALKKLCLTSLINRQFMENLYGSLCCKSGESAEGTTCVVCSKFLSGIPKKERLSHVGAFVSSLFANDHQKHIYERENFQEDPAQHLLLWAAIFNELHLAILFWRISKTNVGGALAAAAVMKAISNMARSDEEKDLFLPYADNSRKFESIARCLLNDCWLRSQKLTALLVVKPNPSWGGGTVLSMSHAGDLKNILSTPACYTKNRQIWRGDISMQTSTWRVLTVAIMPLFVRLLEFEGTNKGDDSGTGSCCSRKHLSGYFMDIKKALSSPIINCIHYGMWLMAFLVMFGFFMMTELQPIGYSASNSTNSTNQSNSNISTESCMDQQSCGSMAYFEICTYLYAFHSLVDTLRRIIKKRKRNRKIDWTKEVLLMLDMFASVCLMIAIILRFTLTQKDFGWTRSFYVVSYALSVHRFSQLFYPSPSLGPKFIIVMNMVSEVGFLVLFLSIVVILFGVVYQSLVFPGAELNYPLVRDIAYKPFFQMFGELFLELYDGWNTVLFGFYLVVTNILVINLLIAIFSNKFQQFQEKAEILWKCSYYELVREHYDRPYVPILGTIYHWLTTDSFWDDGPAFKLRTCDKNAEIKKMEKKCMKKYIETRTDEIAKIAVNTTERLDLLRHELDLHRAEMKKVTRGLESQLQRVTAKLDKVQTARLTSRVDNQH